MDKGTKPELLLHYENSWTDVYSVNKNNKIVYIAFLDGDNLETFKSPQGIMWVNISDNDVWSQGIIHSVDELKRLKVNHIFTWTHDYNNSDSYEYKGRTVSRDYYSKQYKKYFLHKVKINRKRYELDIENMDNDRFRKKLRIWLQSYKK